MNEGDTVILKKDRNKRTGIVLDTEGKYSSWGEYHIIIQWDDGTISYHSVNSLEVISED